MFLYSAESASCLEFLLPSQILQCETGGLLGKSFLTGISITFKGSVPL